MLLIRTGEDFRISGIPKPGIPFLVSKDMETVQAPSDFLLKRSLETIKKSSVEAYAWDLYDYFAFLEDNNISWEDANGTIIALWRESQVEHRGNSRRTYNRRLQTIEKFYCDALKRGFIGGLPFSYRECYLPPRWQLETNGQDATGTPRSVLADTLRTYESAVQFVQIVDAVRFIKSIRPVAWRLCASLQLFSGLRREESLFLRRSVLPAPNGKDPKKMVAVTLDPTITPTKGDKERVVHVPFWLLDQLDKYMETERNDESKKFQTKYGRESDLLFLTEKGEEPALRALQKPFVRAHKLTDVYVSPHLLRHTYATYTLVTLSNKPGWGQAKALEYVRQRLGHSWLSTTARYLHPAGLVNSEDFDLWADVVYDLMSC